MYTNKRLEYKYRRTVCGRYWEPNVFSCHSHLHNANTNYDLNQKIRSLKYGLKDLKTNYNHEAEGHPKLLGV